MRFLGRTRHSSWYRMLALVGAFFVLSNAAFSQATSGVTGVVSDSTGKLIPGATVTLTDTKTDRTLTTTTNDEGSYSFSNVQPGDAYKLTITVQGFQTYNLTAVTLGVAKVETYDAVLSAGDVSATVEVVAASSGDTLNTTDASIGNVIDTRQLKELPIQIRSSPAALIGLQPGVVGNNIGTGAANRVGSVTGARADQGNITIDGFDANDQATGQFAATTGNAPIDSVQEFRATSTNPNASEGRSAGGQVQIVTKSGTNNWHGSLREYHRNEEFAANSYFANRAGSYTLQDQQQSGGLLIAGTQKQPRPHLVRNQFGGSIGGPLPFFNLGNREAGDPYFKSGKDKLFFFFDYEGRRDAQGIASTRVVPLDHFRNGQVAYINNGTGCSSQSRLNTTPGCITILNPAGVAAIDPIHVGANSALLSYLNGRYPRANDFTLGDGINTGGFRFNATSAREDDTYTGRVDANINDSNRLFVRLNIAKRTQDDIVNSVAQQFPGDPRTALIVVDDYLLGGGWSWAISNSIFNQLSIGNSHSGLDFPNLVDPLTPNIWTFMNTTNGGQISAPWGGIAEQNRTVDTPTIRDDVTWGSGGHTFAFGGSWKPIRSVSGIRNDFNFVTVGLGGNRNALGTATRPGDLLQTTTAVNAWDRAFPFSLGRIGSVQTNFNYTFEGQDLPLATGKQRDFRYNEYELYFQDNWKITPSLTLTLGLRWAYYQPPYEANGFQTTHDVDIDELFSTRVANGAAGIGGDSAEPFLTYDLAGKANNRPAYYNGDWNNFGPRIGFAYSPSFEGGVGKWLFGERKTSIRGGYNIQYERVSGALTFVQDQVSYLFDNTSTTAFGGQGASNVDLALDPRFTSINSLPVANVAPTITRPFTPFVDSGFPFGNAEGQTNYTISNQFEVPYYHQYSIGIQRELPWNFLIDVSYVGRLGRKLFSQADAAQIVDFKDPASGQTLLQAFNLLQNELNSGIAPAAVTNQPFFENQGAIAIGGACAAGLGTSCTRFTAANVGALVAIGDASDTVQFANAVGYLPNNVGLSGQFSTNAYIGNLGRSRYDGLLISLQRRFAQGLQFDVNYTYSFAKDNTSSISNTVFGGLVCDLRDLDVCYGPSDFDIRHMANVNGIWELPFGRGKWLYSDASGWVDQLIGGWQLSGIYTYRSGLPFSTTTGSFPVGFVFNSPGVFSGNSSLLSGNIDTTGTAVGFFGNTTATNSVLDAFTNPAGGEIGQRNNIRGPSYWNVDLSLAKNFRMPWEGHRLQVRVDAFNAFNRNVFANPAANINAASFGQITTSAIAPRELQFAIRYDF
ncbi:MAG TPA: carboxypeptidase regulatory-like domain-containing protein [Pyrinomonadaceae bacterium]|nr:carboxypeptidase regulatory-like domain-containing protein [Pyrinomonadaceae bacterium]